MVKTKAFSLLEVTILTFIIGLMIAVTLTSMFSYKKVSLAKIQQELINTDMYYARDYAEAKGQDVDVYFYHDTYMLQSNNVVLKNIYLGKEFSVSPQHLGFTPQGTPKYSGTVYLYHNAIPIARYTVAVASGLMRWTNY